MTQWIKQSTAFSFRIGPFVDATDGVTAETALSILQADIQLSKAGGIFAQSANALPVTSHDIDGWYQCPLVAGDTDTLGTLDVQITMAGALPVWRHFMVVPANVWDSFFGADRLAVDVEEMGASVITSTSFALGAITEDAIAPDAIGDSELAASAYSAIDAQLSATHGAGVWGAGVGASSKVYSVTVDGLPAAGVYCRMTTDTAGLVNIDAGTTDGLGQVTFHHDLPSGTTVYIWPSKDGVTFLFGGGGLPYDTEVIP